MADPVLSRQESTPESTRDGARYRPLGSQPLGVPAAAEAEPSLAACPNCGAMLLGPFCAQCGQRAASRLLSVRYIVQDALEDQLSLDGSLPRTALALLLHPGRLTREYIGGRIRSYVPPMRLYLTCSVLFFLVLAFIAGPDRLAPDVPDAPAAAAKASAASAPRATTAPARATAARAGSGGRVLLPLNQGQTPAGGMVRLGGVEIDTLSGPRWPRERMRVQARRFAGMPPRQAVRQLLASLFNAAPKVAFVLLPVFALLLKALYIRRRRLYVEHFVFALHVHAAAFVALTVMLLAQRALVSALLGACLLLYCFQAMRVVYGQGWFRTLAKLTLLGGAYFLVLCFGVAAGALVAVLTI